jgi:DNA invertase Pin-like site-specific DNA recombinase
VSKNLYRNEDILPLDGLRGIALARCSSEEQTHTTTIQKQIESGRSFAVSNNIQIVDELRLEGLSATRNEHEPYLRKLMQRKEEKDDFDLIIVMRYDRFCRDVKLGRRLYDEFSDLGVEIVSTTQPRHTGKYASIIQDIDLIANQDEVSSLAERSASGIVKAVEERRIPPVVACSFAVDKLFISLNRRARI